MGVFWTSWALWQKLCFVLGGGIVIVLVLGSFRLAYNTWRIRKYAKIRAHRLASKREMRHVATVKRRRTKKVPFGIRALEAGVEVEGIWHSKANTPVPSRPSSPTLAPTDPIQRHHDPKSGTESPSSSPELKANDLLALGPASSTQKPPSIHQHYKPRRSSGLRFSNAHIDQAPDASHLSHPPSQAPSPSAASSSSASISPALMPHHSAYAIENTDATGETNPFLTPTSTHKSMDADVEAFPLQQLGGLVPTDIGIVPDSDYHNELLNAAELAYQDNHHHHYSKTAKLMQEPHTLHRAAAFSFEDLHDPCPARFHHKATIAAAKPLSEIPSTILADDSPPATAGQQASRRSSMLQRPSLSINQPAPYPTDPVPSDNTTTASRPPSFTADKRHSNVIRKINSGFEILRPGTFDAAITSSGSGAKSGSSRGMRQSGEWLGDREGKKEKRGRLVKKKGRESLL